MRDETGYCGVGVACVCGGDVQAVRHGCGNWVKVRPAKASYVPPAADEPILARLRDEFAMAALTGWLAHQSPASMMRLFDEAGDNILRPYQIIATDAYRMADAMLEARGK